MGDNNILTFHAIGSTKKVPLEKLHFGAIFSIHICKVSYFMAFFTGLKGLSPCQN